MIVIPDIHGRTYWKDAVAGKENEKIVFLGDYTDPYEYEGVTYEQTLENLKDIIEFKRQHMDNVVLLLGNHDCSYAIGTHICDCRRDRVHYKEIEKLFDDNRSLFKLAHIENVSGKDILFSHAGLHKEYADRLVDNYASIQQVVDTLNSAWINDEYGTLNSLCKVSFYRGGYGDAGSIVWADVIEFVNIGNQLDVYQMFGHTQLKQIYATDTYACIDCHKAVILTDLPSFVSQYKKTN